MPNLENLLVTGKSTLSAFDGGQPNGPLTDGGNIPINNTFNQGKYTNYVVDVDPERVTDTTPYSN